MDTALLDQEPRAVGPYTLTRLLGVGGMGEVWGGYWTHESGARKSVAVKVLTRAHDQRSREMFEDEARLSMLLCNSNIVQVFDVGEDRGINYMAMEWVEGLNLDEVNSALRKAGQRLPLVVVAYLVGELLKALAYAHDFDHEGQRRCIVHRDISPHNVMLSVAGEVKLMDFGIARMSSEDTQSGLVKGKLRYMPPEQLRGDTRAPTIDLFAVGAILHELLDGHRFREGVVDDVRLYGMVLDGEYPPLRCGPERAAPELEQLCRALLRSEASERPQSAREAHRILARWPGYRDAKFELEDLVRDHVSRERAASPIVGATGSSLAAATRSGPTTQPSGLRSRSATTPRATETHVGSAGRKRKRRRGVLALAGFGVVAGGLGAVALTQWHRGEQVQAAVAVPQLEDQAPEPSRPEVPKARTPAPASEASLPELEAAAEPPAPTEELEPELLLEDEDEDEDEGESDALAPAEELEPEPQPPALKVKLTLSAGARFWTEIKLAGRKRVIAKLQGGAAKVWVRPGRYPVSYREEAQGEWRSAGSVIIEEGSSKVTISAAGKAIVK